MSRTPSRRSFVAGGLAAPGGTLAAGALSMTGASAQAFAAAPEAAMQVRGQAGEHQVDGARTALGHAYGGGSQFFAMWVVGSEKPSN